MARGPTGCDPGASAPSSGQSRVSHRAYGTATGHDASERLRTRTDHRARVSVWTLEAAELDQRGVRTIADGQQRDVEASIKAASLAGARRHAQAAQGALECVTCLPTYALVLKRHALLM